MKTNDKILRKNRTRAKISGTNIRPRLSVSVSLSHIQAQLIDDIAGKTLAAANDLKLTEKMTKAEKAAKVGEEIAKAAAGIEIKKVVFDRGAKLYHGRIKSLAEAARKAGLQF